MNNGLKGNNRKIVYIKHFQIYITIIKTILYYETYFVISWKVWISGMFVMYFNMYYFAQQIIIFKNHLFIVSEMQINYDQYLQLKIIVAY